MNIRVELHADNGSGFAWGEIDADEVLLRSMPPDVRRNFIGERIAMKFPVVLAEYDTRVNRL